MASSLPTVNRIRENMRKAAAESGLSQDEIGKAMGFKSGGARQAVSRLLNSEIEYDPRLSTLLSFAKAVKKNVRDLI
jgi:transcriptional regulator with XRE-family HTH domain